MKIYRNFFKRVIDIAASGSVLLILAVPLAVVTVWLHFANKGAGAFFTQERPGLHGRIFRIIKFKTMTDERGADGRLLPDGQRITRVGRFVRSTSIDELPQLFNILKGEMSFIGPRPERPEIIAQYVEDMPEFVFRMKVKAGLAGYAQVYGKYNTTPYDKLKLDLAYIENYTVWLDIKLMLLTLKILFKPESTEGIDSSQITAMRQEEDK